MISKSENLSTPIKTKTKKNSVNVTAPTPKKISTNELVLSPKTSGSKKIIIDKENLKINIENLNKDSSENKDDVVEFKVISPTSKLRKSTLLVNKNVEKVYKIVRQVTGTLGGNGYNGAIYGELTMRSMQRVLNILIEKCNLNSSSRFIDVGAGLGKPNFHVAQDPEVRLSLGVELEEIRWQLSMHNLDRFLSHTTEVEQQSSRNKSKNNKLNTSSSELVESKDRKSKLHGGVNFALGDIDDTNSLDPFTHVYMFDLGFPPLLQKSIAMKFNNSVHPVCLVSYRPPRRVIHEYGYAVELVEQVLSSMHGSGEGHTAYIYKRINTPPTKPTLPNQKVLTIPGRIGLKEETIEVFCDEAFYNASKLAVEDITVLKTYVKEKVHEHTNSSRSKREHKQRVITDASEF